MTTRSVILIGLNFASCAVEVTDSNFNDFPALLNTTAKRFTMQRVSADKGYLGQSNVVAIVSHGAEQFIPPKANTAFRRPVDASRKKAAVWDTMLHYYLYRLPARRLSAVLPSALERGNDVPHDQIQVWHPHSFQDADSSNE